MALPLAAANRVRPCKVNSGQYAKWNEAGKLEAQVRREPEPRGQAHADGDA